jgi:hypothetical protein
MIDNEQVIQKLIGKWQFLLAIPLSYTRSEIGNCTWTFSNTEAWWSYPDGTASEIFRYQILDGEFPARINITSSDGEVCAGWVEVARNLLVLHLPTDEGSLRPDLERISKHIDYQLEIYIRHDH